MARRILVGLARRWAGQTTPAGGRHAYPLYFNDEMSPELVGNSIIACRNDLRHGAAACRGWVTVPLR